MHLRFIREAYKNAGNLDPSKTTLLECHGTGTRVGDPIEVTAAGNVFGPSRSSEYEDRLIVGSVKANLGHLEGACALPGILKVVAASEQGDIPPTLGFQTPNPRIDFQNAKARVTTSVESWPKNKLRRASVTYAGFGGTNGHCIIDHVHNMLPSYLKPGILGQCVQEMTKTNSDSHAKGTNGHVAIAMLIPKGNMTTYLVLSSIVGSGTIIDVKSMPCRVLGGSRRVRPTKIGLGTTTLQIVRC